jgi:BMFP domain-containing protein YqiC
MRMFINILMADNTNVDDTVNSLLNQLKNVPTVVKKVDNVHADEITRENIEKFVIQHASRLIENATESVECIKDNVQAAPTAEDVVSLSELIKSTSSAIEILNKIALNKEKLSTSVKIKEMDIANKREELEVKTNVFLATREEVLQQLINKSAKIIEVKSSTEN